MKYIDDGNNTILTFNKLHNSTIFKFIFKNPSGTEFIIITDGKTFG